MPQKPHSSHSQRWWSSFKRAAARRGARRSQVVSLRLEQLEDRITPSAPSISELASFTISGGYSPRAPLLMDHDGNLYGTTYFGGPTYNPPGSFGDGGVFELAHGSSTITPLAYFNGTNGANPWSSLIMDSRGNLYGTTQHGGTSDEGTVFELAHGSNTITTLASFDGDNGFYPYAGVIMDSSGNLYGTTANGGSGGWGTIFELAHDSSTITTLASFNFSDGAGPQAGLIMDGSGNLYGTAEGGGADKYGTVFELVHGSSAITTLASFDGTNGAGPTAGVIMDSSGNLFGTTHYAGPSGDGTVFELAHGSGAITTLTSFSSTTGELPSGVIMDGSGNLYGTTYEGGPSSYGTVFELAQGSGTISTLTSFNQGNGANPDAGVGVIMDSIGNLYGSTTEGGEYSPDFGRIFELQVAAPHLAFEQQPSDPAKDATMASVTVAVENSFGTPETYDYSDKISLAIGPHSPSGTLDGTTLMTLSGGEATFNDLSINQAGKSYSLVASTNASGVNSIVSSSFNITPANVTATANDATAVLPSAQTVTLSAGVADASVPSNTVDEGTVTFTVKKGSTAIGSPVQGTVSDGTASASFTLPSGLAQGDYAIAVSYSDSQGNYTDSGDTSATLTVLLVPTVTTNPSNQTVTAGNTATFMAAANGNPAPTVQWQVSTDDGKTFNYIGGAMSSTLTLKDVTAAMNGEEYRAVFTNSLGSTTTTAATLNVQFAPVVITNPTSRTVTAGQTATFTAAANGNPNPTVQWQVSTDGGKTFTKISGATSTALTLKNVTAAMNGDEYQAVFANSIGTATSSAATLGVQFAPIVTTKPISQTVTAGQNATFTAAANANPTATVRWQVSTNGGKTFTNISGATSLTLALNAVTAAMYGDEYQALFTNSIGSTATTAATLNVQFAPVVTTNPNNQTLTAGQKATFTAAASANPQATVQWQVSSDGGKTFGDIGGATNTTLTLNNLTAAMNGDEYQAVFTNSLGAATTTIATLTVKYTPMVETNPSDQTVTVGHNATFTATANGNPTPTVQWQVSSDGGKTFSNIQGATSTTLTLTNVTAAMNGNVYQAVFANIVGTVTSDAATLIVQATSPSPPPTPNPPPLNPPPVLASINGLLAGVESVNADGSATITDSIFGIPLFVSTFNASGQLVSVTLFGIDITFLFLLL